MTRVRRGSSKRSYVVEIALTAAVVIVLYVFMTNGGPEWFGRWFAEMMVNAGQ